MIRVHVRQPAHGERKGLQMKRNSLLAMVVALGFLRPILAQNTPPSGGVLLGPPRALVPAKEEAGRSQEAAQPGTTTPEAVSLGRPLALSGNSSRTATTPEIVRCAAVDDPFFPPYDPKRAAGNTGGPVVLQPVTVTLAPPIQPTQAIIGPPPVPPPPPGGAVVVMPPNMPPPPVGGPPVVPGPGPACPAATCGNIPNAFWAEAEYLLWFLKSSPVHYPLVTTGDIGDPIPGALNQPGTRTLFGDRTANGDPYSGFRFRVGGMVPGVGVGMEAGGFFMLQQDTRFNRQSDPAGNPIIALPFYDAFHQAESAVHVAFPGKLAGGVSTALRTNLYGADLNAVFGLGGPVVDRIFVGFRYLELNETLTLTDQSNVLLPGALSFNGTPLVGGDGVVIQDSFGTTNKFYGGQVGAYKRWIIGALEFDGRVSLALGDTVENLHINGTTTLNPANGSAFAVVPGGLFAQASNIGRHSQSEFSAIPELNLNVGYRFTPNVKVFVGYSFLYWSNVIRPGDQIDPRIDPRQVPTSPSFINGSNAILPGTTFHRTDFWAQGLNLGVSVNF